MSRYDAVVIGSGPNGLAAAVRLAESGQSVLVLEQSAEIGGGTRTRELTLPGFHHDVCSAIHPMGLASPYLKTLPLAEHGLEWIHPEIPAAHPFPDGSAACLFRDVDETADQFDASSAKAYRFLFRFLSEHFDELLYDAMAPPRIPKHPLTIARFGMSALPSALDAARAFFSDEKARALLAGNAAHSVMPLDRPLATNAIGLMLMLAGHAYGWPMARGGSQSISNALASYLESLDGKIETGVSVERFQSLPSAKAYLFDTTPSALAAIAEKQLPESYRNRLNRFRHGPGIFKIDYALSSPIPWTSESCRRAGTVHLGASLDEIAQSERDMWQGHHSERPFVLTAQQSVFDKTRAPEGGHTFWAYCHVPKHSTVDMTKAIEAQIERFAPGFQDCVKARHTMNCEDFAAYNPNLIGGDIVGGVTDWRQLLTRPVARWKPHTTPNPSIYLCSSSTPPGGGVHGMGGYWASEEVLKAIK